jgi:hypothetical protein
MVAVQDQADRPDRITVPNWSYPRLLRRIETPKVLVASVRGWEGGGPKGLQSWRR